MSVPCFVSLTRCYYSSPALDLDYWDVSSPSVLKDAIAGLQVSGFVSVVECVHGFLLWHIFDLCVAFTLCVCALSAQYVWWGRHCHEVGREAVRAFLVRLKGVYVCFTVWLISCCVCGAVLDDSAFCNSCSLYFDRQTLPWKFYSSRSVLC